MPFHAYAQDYAGVLFRSRLEARWAVYFNGFRIRWRYEPSRGVFPLPVNTVNASIRAWKKNHDTWPVVSPVSLQHTFQPKTLIYTPDFVIPLHPGLDSLSITTEGLSSLTSNPRLEKYRMLAVEVKPTINNPSDLYHQLLAYSWNYHVPLLLLCGDPFKSKSSGQVSTLLLDPSLEKGYIVVRENHLTIDNEQRSASHRAFRNQPIDPARLTELPEP